jgi:hypothetical protein
MCESDQRQAGALSQIIAFGGAHPTQYILARMVEAASDRAQSIGEESSLAYLAEEALAAALEAGALAVAHRDDLQGARKVKNAR